MKAEYDRLVGGDGPQCLPVGYQSPHRVRRASYRKDAQHGNPSKGKRGSFEEGSLVLGVRAQVGEGAGRPSRVRRASSQRGSLVGVLESRQSERGTHAWVLKTRLHALKAKEMRTLSPWETG